MSRSTHWDQVYMRSDATKVSWYEANASSSLAAIAACGLPKDAPLLDVGSGASTLVDGLLERGFTDVTLLDVSEQALERAKARLGDRTAVHFAVADVTKWKPDRTYALWHDRAMFHFLVDPEEREAYRRTMDAAVAPAGHVIIATFALTGPDRCSGLPVHRWSGETLAAELDDLLVLESADRVVHVTPAGNAQAFTVARFRRR